MSGSEQIELNSHLRVDLAHWHRTARVARLLTKQCPANMTMSFSYSMKLLKASCAQMRKTAGFFVAVG